MEKVFQIQLGGMLFTIEEQAYQTLKGYLEKLHRHFAGNSEIIADIESRMAELFVSRLNTGKTTLFTQDVIEVTGILGDINQMSDEGEPQKSTSQEQKIEVDPQFRKLRRNPYDQSLGGVCSGFASFFGVDPVVVRVLFILLVIGYGSGVLFYLIFWIALPVATGKEAEYIRMQQQNRSRKLFRDPDERVIGGVSAGLANYFGLEVVWVRIFFIVALLFFTAGFWLYILMWIIIPKALSASDKLLMKGLSVDIRNIERQVLENQNQNKVNSIAQHGSHVAGIVARGFLKLVGIFIAAVLFMMVVGISIAMLAFYLKLGKTSFLNELIEFTVRDSGIIWAAKVGLLLTLICPILLILLGVLRGLFKLRFINRVWLFSILGVFVIGVLLMGYSLISFSGSVSRKASSSSVQSFKCPDTLRVEGIGMPYDDNSTEDFDGEIVFRNKGVLNTNKAFLFEIDDIKIKSGKGENVVIKVIERANGSSLPDAQQRIKMISYKPEIRGNTIVIPNYFSLTKDKQFAWQEVDVVLIIPENKLIMFDDIAKEMVDDYSMDEADGNIYQVKDNELKCVDCAGDNPEFEEEAEDSGDENFEIHIKGKDDEENVDIKISGNKDENEKKKSGKKKTTYYKKENGREVKVEETQLGNLTLKKKTEINQK